ncbi:IS5 family transposase [Sphingomonas sp. MMSM20]|nr:IS5 family transposase [Sphingomonas lycopersici]MCW6533154.1 IS5 family transposase [Sphingomonas lycopersici]
MLPNGRCGARRVDDRRVISGIVHMLRIGARWRDCPPEYGPYTTIYNRFHRWSRQGVWFAVFEALSGYSGAWGSVAIDSTSIKVHRSAGGAKGGPSQGIGTSRGGRTSKIHGLTDTAGRPRILLISPGNTSDMTMAPALIEAARGRFDRLLADRGYDSNAIRSTIAAQGAEVVIPSTRSRKSPISYDRDAYRARNLVERLWCRLKDWRRIATRYDKLAANYMAGVFLAAVITFWCD